MPRSSWNTNAPELLIELPGNRIMLPFGTVQQRPSELLMLSNVRLFPFPLTTFEPEFSNRFEVNLIALPVIITHIKSKRILMDLRQLDAWIVREHTSIPSRIPVQWLR